MIKANEHYQQDSRALHHTFATTCWQFSCLRLGPIYELLDMCVEIIEYLIENNVVLDPGLEALKDIKYEKFSVDNHNAHIYWLLELLKCGLTGDGAERSSEYATKLGKDAFTLISLIDLENIPVDVQREVVRRIREGSARFLPEELPTTHLEALLVEMLGLPISTVHLFWSVVKSTDESHIGGANEIQSFLRRLLLCIFESGLQEYMYRRDPSSINQSSMEHEFINGNHLGFYIWSVLHAKEDIDATSSGLPSSDQTVLSSKSVRSRARSTWPPGVLKQRFCGATDCILDHQFGVGNWENSTDVTPLDCLEEDEFILAKAVELGCRKCIAESTTDRKSRLGHKDKCPRKPTTQLCYAKYLYKSNHQLAMMVSKDLSLEDVVKIGGVIVLDEDKVATQVLNDGKGMDLVQYILESEPQLPNGSIGKWKHYRRYLRLQVLTLDYDGDNRIRIAVVHVRTCSMIDTAPNNKWDWDTVDDMGIDARTMLWIEFFNAEVTSPKTDLITDKSLHCSLNNLMFAWTITVGSAPNTHIAPKPLALYFKNYLKQDNLFLFDKNGLRKDGDYDNNKIMKKCVCSLTRAAKGDLTGLDIRLKATAGIVRDATPGAASARNTKMSNYIKDPLASQFEIVWAQGRQNRGRKANFAANNDQIDANDLMVAEMMYTGSWYTVQGIVVEGSNPTKAAGVNFTPPAPGTVIRSAKRPCGTYKLDPDSDELTEVKYLTSPPAPFVPNLVYESFRNRTKKPTAGGKTKKKTCVKFPDYKLVTPIIPKGKGRGARESNMIRPPDHIPRDNVAVIRFEWKNENNGTEEDRLNELRDHLSANGIEIEVVNDEDSDSDGI